jgi:5'-deoxynucleotidase YfbR-like HD superfamily hydrolase
VQINLREMLLGETDRMRYVVRFGNCRKIHFESVAEHSYFVAFYSMLIAEHLRTLGASVNIEELLKRCLLHDLEECRSGDFPRNFKHSNSEIKKFLDQAGEKAFEQVVLPMVCGDPEALEHLKDAWIDSKDATLEGRILEFADFLGCLAYLWFEFKAGNRTVLSHVRDMDQYFRRFKGAEFQFLGFLVDDSGTVLKEIFDAKV